MRTAVFSCLGLGDGLISLVLSHNLVNNGWDVTTFHPSLKGLQGWFPRLPLMPFPAKEEMEKVLSEFDRFFLFFEKSEWMLSILEFCKARWPDKLTVLNPIATKRCDYPFWEGGKFDGQIPFVDNLLNFCRNSLQLPQVSNSNGITPPESVIIRRYPNRIVIHPKSSRESKNWPWEKFATLARQLENEGYEPWFALTNAEKATLPPCRSPNLLSLSDTAQFVAESGAMIGNDSGIGHLASCLGLPTVTICRHKQASYFWRPAWTPGTVLTPPALIPNLKGMRWRDKYWKYCISVSRVQNAFIDLYKKN